MLNGYVSSSGHSWHTLEGLHRQRKENCVKWLCLFFRTLKAHTGRTGQTEGANLHQMGDNSSSVHSGHALEGMQRRTGKQLCKRALSVPCHTQATALLGRTGKEIMTLPQTTQTTEIQKRGSKTMLKSHTPLPPSPPCCS